MKFLQAGAVLAAVAIPSITAVSHTSLQGNTGLKVAIVDSTHISTASTWAKTNFRDKIDKEGRGYETQLQKLALDIERVRRDQLLDKAGSHTWSLKQVEIDTLNYRRKLLSTTYRRWLDEQLNLAGRAIHARVAEAVKAVSEKQGINLVFKKRGTRDPKNPAIQDALRLDQVIYAGSVLDITDDVLELVDDLGFGTANATSSGGGNKTGATASPKKDGK